MSFLFHTSVLAVFPHTDVQLVVLPRRGLTGQRMGCFQAIQPLRCKEFVGPTLIITPSATSLLAQAFAEDATQPHPNPPVQVVEHVVAAMFEVLKPAAQPRVDRRDDHLQALPRAPALLVSARLCSSLLVSARLCSSL